MKFNKKYLISTIFLITLFIIPTVFAEQGIIELLNESNTVIYTGPTYNWPEGLNTQQFNIKNNNLWCAYEGQWKTRLKVPTVDVIGGTAYSTPVNAQYINWDQDKDACECKISTQENLGWNNDDLWLEEDWTTSINSVGGGCCGDDLGDNGFVYHTDSIDWICGVNIENNDQVKWYRSSERLLKIFKFPTFESISSEQGGDPIDYVFYECISADISGSPSPSGAIKINPGETVPIAGEHSYPEKFGNKFLCSRTNDRTHIMECCSDEWCINRLDNPNNIVLTGSTDSVIFDGGDSYTGDMIDNTWKSGTIVIGQDAVLPNLRMNTWNGYEYLEFDLKFKGYPRSPPKFLMIESGSGTFSKELSDLAVYFVPDTWNHIIIPIEEIDLEYPITSIKITAPFGESSEIEIDNMFLRNADTSYCSAEAINLDDTSPTIWIKDLDPETGLFSDELRPYENACNAVKSFGWTGSSCCGDDSSNIKDEGEFYIDEIGGCWDSKTILEGKTVSESLGIPEFKDVLFKDGTFKVCTESTKYPLYTAKGLTFDSAEYCEISGDYFCSFDNEWSNALEGSGSSGSRDTKKEIMNEFTDEQIRELFNILDSTEIKEKSCCPKDYCWNGVMCVPGITVVNSENYYLPSYSLSTNKWEDIPSLDSDNIDSYVCYSEDDSANWGEGYIKYSYDYEGSENLFNYREYYGICGREDQCYARGTKSCINNGDFYLDHYCDEGVWTSRTKILAEKMLSLVEENSDYDLFCDEYNLALNRFEYYIDEINSLYIIKGLPSISPLGGASYSCYTNSGFPCTNNYCILETDNKVFLGTTFNLPIESGNNKFLQLIDINNCDNVLEIDDENYHYCNTAQTTWYNNKTKSIIYSKNTFAMPEDMTFGEKFISIFLHPIRTLSDLLKPMKKGTGFEDIYVSANITYVNLTKDYRNIYSSKIGQLETTGIKENIDNNRGYYYIKYNSTEVNLCEKAFELGLGCDMTTENENNIYHIVTSDKAKYQIWKDFTAKIR